jgi:hypothetical protein
MILNLPNSYSVLFLLETIYKIFLKFLISIVSKSVQILYPVYTYLLESVNAGYRYNLPFQF